MKAYMIRICRLCKKKKKNLRYSAQSKFIAVRKRKEKKISINAQPLCCSNGVFRFESKACLLLRLRNTIIFSALS